MITDACFTGETLVKIHDGSTAELSSLVNSRFVWIWSYDKSLGYIGAIAGNVRKIKDANRLIHLTFDNNKTIRCTEDHLFMLSDGTYRPAIELQVGQKLMSPADTPHAILYKQIIKYQQPEPVYNLYVPERHNFVLECGVVAHDCFVERREEE